MEKQELVLIKISNFGKEKSYHAEHTNPVKSRVKLFSFTKAVEILSPIGYRDLW